MEQKKSSVFKKISIGYLVGMVLYISGSFLLKATRLEYRMWISVLGSCLLLLGGPVWLFLLWFRWHAREEKSRLIRYLVTAAAAVLFLLWSYFVFLALVFGLQEERKLFDRYVVVNRAPALRETRYELCESVGFLFRKEADWDTSFEIEYLERKYRQDFMEIPFDRETMLFYDQRDGNISYQETVPVSPEHPNLPVNVVLAGASLEDDYVGLLTRWYIVEGCRKLGIDRSYQIEDNGSLFLHLADKEDIRAAASDVQKLIDYAMQDEIYRDYSGAIHLIPEDGEWYECIYVSFGRTNQGNGIEYGDGNSLLEAYLEEQYDRILEKRKERLKDEAERERMQAEEKAEEAAEETEETAEPEEMQESIYEKEARLVYDVIKESEGIGDEFTAEYNARGQEYFMLGEDGTYSYTLVYDRDSKNGACSLYVLYCSPYNAESGSYYYYTDTMTQIMDVYAVVKGTGEVISSGKKTWSDPGNREYRMATGE